MSMSCSNLRTASTTILAKNSAWDEINFEAIAVAAQRSNIWRRSLHYQSISVIGLVTWLKEEFLFPPKKSNTYASFFVWMLTAISLTFCLARAQALRSPLMIRVGWTPSSMNFLASVSNSPAKITTLVVPSPTCSQFDAQQKNDFFGIDKNSCNVLQRANLFVLGLGNID